MAILLMVLKIIGIILLILLGLMILVTLLLLFVPVRYEIKGNFKDKDTYDFSVRISWLLRIIQFKLLGQGKTVTQRITIFGIRLKKREKVKTKKKKNKSSEDDNNIEGNLENSQIVQEENRKDEVYHKEPVEDNQGCETCEEGTDGEKVGIFTKIKNFFKSLISKIKQTFRKICDTIKTVKDKIQKIDEFLHDEKNIELFTLGKNELFYLLKHYMPRKWKGRLLLGTGDPASTGYALGTLYALYPVHGGNLIVTPDFDNKVIEGNVFVRGRIRGVHTVRTVIHLFKNKHLRNMIFKNNGGNSSGRK
ncbi:MAG: DUF2953 domain-containing protein [Lachnospiraceae bacterium]|nr:DUF2953 domain-containing protein [Lachnospiraceae bacterium]